MNLRKKLFTGVIAGSLLALPYFADATNSNTLVESNVAAFESDAQWITQQDCNNWYPGTTASGDITGAFPDSVVWTGGCYDESLNLVYPMVWYMKYESDPGGLG